MSDLSNEPGPIENHRGREKGALVYPVFSRRSKGLSLGVNLFPDRKRCSFDCPYCEVFPFETDIAFRPDVMEEALIERINWAKESQTPVRDICFSGNGEPTGSPHFPEALEAAARIRNRHAPDAALVLITNAAGLIDDSIFAVLREYASGSESLAVWLKLDAGTAGWYEKMNRSRVPRETLLRRIREFVLAAPVILQTMLCTIDGTAPSAEEAAAWEKLVAELAVSGGVAAPESAGLRGVQLYGKARPAPEDPRAGRAPPAYLEERAASLRRVLSLAGQGEIPVTVYQ
jgi:histidinol dehydrogenase